MRLTTRILLTFAICMVVLCAAATEEYDITTASDIVPDLPDLATDAVAPKKAPTVTLHESFSSVLQQVSTEASRRSKAWKYAERAAYRRNPKMCKDWIPKSRCDFWRKRYPT